jgi:UDP-2,3-diacylglucosamine pyrophosphatase LpxH
LKGFLEYVRRLEGKLIVAGDMLELWAYRLEDIVARRGELLDEFAEMGAIYVPGNHDWQVATAKSGDIRKRHRFFDNVRGCFTRTIGGRRFKFMHGHEVDPFNCQTVANCGRMIVRLAYVVESRRGFCVLRNDELVDGILEKAEHLVRPWYWFRDSLRRMISKGRFGIEQEQVRYIKNQLRVHRMLSRYWEDRQKGLYEVAVAGHTHKAGRHGDWYLNAGSWTGSSNSFLRILPDGQAEVFDWTARGAVARQDSLVN